VNCKLLPKKEEWQKNYSPSRVVIHSADKDNVFDADIWPLVPIYVIGTLNLNKMVVSFTNVK